MSGVRFAPSPTGRFHLGNLRTAWVSWKFAQELKLPWIVRFEDIDRPRVLSGAKESQLDDMKALGLVPSQIIVQSERFERHWSLFEKAVAEGQVYPCVCSRKEVQEALESHASAPHLALGSAPPLYGGKCRPGVSSQALGIPQGATIGWRFRNDDPSGGHDFIVARTNALVPDRASFVPAYHWACAIDDEDGRYDLLVRAADLKSASELQRKIQAWVAKTENRTPRFAAVFHTALVVQNDGHRLEKRTRGVTLPELQSKGVSVEAILRAFEASFKQTMFKSQFQSAEIKGEIKESIPLSDLQISL